MKESLILLLIFIKKYWHSYYCVPILTRGILYRLHCKDVWTRSNQNLDILQKSKKRLNGGLFKEKIQKEMLQNLMNTRF